MHSARLSLFCQVFVRAKVCVLACLCKDEAWQVLSLEVILRSSFTLRIGMVISIRHSSIEGE